MVHPKKSEEELNDINKYHSQRDLESVNYTI